MSDTNLTIVLHLNSFTRKLEGGCIAVRTSDDGARLRSVTANMSPTAAIAWLAEHPHAQIEMLYV